MDIQEKEWGSFVEYLKTKGVIKIGQNALGIITNLVREGGCTLGYNDLELMWETWRDAKAQAVPEGFVVFPKKQTSKMRLLARDFDARLSLIKYEQLHNIWVKQAMIEAQEQK